MQKFSWKADFKRIMWKETSLVNLLRSFVAGIVWAVIVALGAGGPHAGYMPLLYPVYFPIAYFIFLLPVGLACSFICKFDFPFLWIFAFVTILFSIMLIPADPILFIIQKIKPKLVPVEKYGFINFNLIIFVLAPRQQTSAAGI